MGVLVLSDLFVRAWYSSTNRRLRPGEAEKVCVERLPLGLVAAQDRDDAGKGEHAEAVVSESEIAAEETGW